MTQQTPHVLFEVSVKAAIVNERGQVLVLEEHSRERKWMLPGGRIQKNETPMTALLRELKEEIGTDAAIISGVIDIDVGVRRTPPILAITYLGSMPSATVLALSTEHGRYRWVGMDDLGTIEFWVPKTRDVIERAIRQQPIL